MRTPHFTASILHRVFILSCKSCPVSRHGKQSEFEEKADPWGHWYPPALFLSAEKHPNTCTFLFPLMGPRWAVKFGGHRLSRVAVVDLLPTSWQYLGIFLCLYWYSFTKPHWDCIRSVQLPTEQSNHLSLCVYQPKLAFYLT